MIEWFKRKKKNKAEAAKNASAPEGLPEEAGFRGHGEDGPPVTTPAGAPIAEYRSPKTELREPGEEAPVGTTPAAEYRSFETRLRETGEDDPAGLMAEAPRSPVESAGQADALAEGGEEGPERAGTEPVGIEETGEREKRRFFKKLRERLFKSRENLALRLDRLVLGKKTIDQDVLDNLEEVLITSDLGVHTTQLILKAVAEKVKRKELSDPLTLRGHIRDHVRGVLSLPVPAWNPRTAHPFVILVIGVNGVGKTTTIGKLAHRMKREGLNVLLVAADTFRAAAAEQLTLWGERAGIPVVRQKSGSDPSAVVYDGMDAAVARGVDVMLIDTAGRMHTKVNLMDELKKIQRTIKRKMPEAPHEVLLVLDASTGQNALSQARLFKESLGITGLILTKLDGTAKGGVVVSICDELQVPVRYIGIGEAIEDLTPFDPDGFAQALF